MRYKSLLPQSAATFSNAQNIEQRCKYDRCKRKVASVIVQVYCDDYFLYQRGALETPQGADECCRPSQFITQKRPLRNKGNSFLA